jgi:hypothetical protein
VLWPTAIYPPESWTDHRYLCQRRFNLDPSGGAWVLRRIRAVLATLMVQDGIARACAELRQLSVLSGLLLSRASIARRSSAEWTDRSLPLGGYRRSSPLVFPFMPLAGIGWVSEEHALGEQQLVLRHLQS